MVFGYFIWLILPRLTTSETIGIASTIISLTIIFSSIIDLGVSSGSTRFLGKSFSRRTGDAKVLVNASLLITCTSIIVSNIAILVFKDSIFPTIGIDLITISILLIDTFVIYNVLRSILIATLETKLLPKIILLSSICKFIMIFILVLVGTGAIGITIGYLSGYATGALLISFTLVAILSCNTKETPLCLFNACERILIASIPRWVPIFIGVLGTNLGTVFVFGVQGASQAASYFIAFSIFYAILSIRDSLFAVALPVLSAMDDQRKILVSKLIKMSLVISLPLCSIVFLYSNDIMGLIGPHYLQSSMALKIMLLSTLPSTFAVGVGNLLYSYGNYRKDLAIGIGMNLPRILLYIILVPLYGDTGAAISLTIGSLVGFAVSVIMAKRIGMLIFWQQLALIFIIPMGLAFTLGYFHPIPIIGVPVILVLSLVLFFILQILTKSDVRTSLDLLPDSIVKPLIKKLNRLR